MEEQVDKTSQSESSVLAIDTPPPMAAAAAARTAEPSSVEGNGSRGVSTDSWGRSIRGSLSLGKISGIYVWIALIVIFSLWLPNVFPTVLTVRNIADSQTVAGVVTMGLLFSLAAGIFDLSVGFAVGTLSIVGGILLRSGMSAPTAIVITLLIALGIGLFNSLLVVVLGLDSFIATLGTSSLLQALGIALSKQQQVIGFPASFTKLGVLQPLGVPIGVVYVLVLALVAHIVLEHTTYGRHLYAIGGGKEAARLAGVRTGLYTTVALMVTALCAGLGGLLLAAKVGAASPDLGPEYLLPAFAAAFLGATQIRPGRMNVPGTLIAVYLLATGSTGLQLAGANTWVPYAFNGGALIIAVGLGATQSRFATLRMIRARRRAVEVGKAT